MQDSDVRRTKIEVFEWIYEHFFLNRIPNLDWNIFCFGSHSELLQVIVLAIAYLQFFKIFVLIDGVNQLDTLVLIQRLEVDKEQFHIN